MKKSGQYKATHLIESQFEPGSNNKVLKNKLEITSPDEMDRREKEEMLWADIVQEAYEQQSCKTDKITDRR